ncbi:MAG: response regulator [Candidatus Omnitrophica bacterium]|nr:response regulator [Candidatus Omnitrophota bacterium]MBI2173654.1 response regulator [Candidatus Omnitrophota bacterium]
MVEKKRILLVDDEPSIVKMVSKRLEVEGFEVLTAYDGHAGLLAAQSQQPDLIILDLMLPKMNGYEVCRLLKFDQKSQHIPIILFTARAQEKDEQLGNECGADAYVRKPFKSEELLGKVRSLLPSSATPEVSHGA